MSTTKQNCCLLSGQGDDVPTLSWVSHMLWRNSCDQLGFKVIIALPPQHLTQIMLSAFASRHRVAHILLQVELPCSFYRVFFWWPFLCANGDITIVVWEAHHAKWEHNEQCDACECYSGMNTSPRAHRNEYKSSKFDEH